MLTWMIANRVISTWNIFKPRWDDHVTHHVQDKQVVLHAHAEYVYTSVAALTSMRDVFCLDDKFLDDN